MRNRFKKIFPSILASSIIFVSSFLSLNIFLNNNNNKYQSQITNSKAAVSPKQVTKNITNFSSYNAIVNEPTFENIQTNLGFFGKTEDNKRIVLTSLDGLIIWELDLVNDSSLKQYYNTVYSIGDISTYQMHSWTYIESTKKLVVLFGTSDNKNMSVFAVDADFGNLYLPFKGNNGASNITSNIATVKDGSNFVNQLSNGNIFVSKKGVETQVIENRTIVKVSDSGVVRLDPSFNMIITSATDKLLYIIPGRANSNINLAVFLDTSNKYKATVVNDDLLGVTNGSNARIEIDLGIVFESDNSTFVTYDKLPNFGFRYTKDSTSNSFVVSTVGTNSNVIVVNYNGQSRTLSKGPSKSLSTRDSGDYAKYISYDLTNNRLYISNSKSKNGNVVSYVDIANTGSSLNYRVVLNKLTPSGSDGTIDNPLIIAPINGFSNANPPFVFMDKTQQNKLFSIKSNNFGVIEQSPLKFNKWNDPVNAFKNNAIYKNKMPSNIQASELTRFLTFANNTSTNNGAINVSVSSISGNNDLGTLDYRYTVSYTNWWNGSKNSFVIPVHIDGLYNYSKINLNFVTIDTEQNNTKFEAINNLKKTKRASQITKQEVINNFFIADIRDKNGNVYNVTQNDITLTTANNDYTLNVRIKLSNASFPTGIADNRLTFSQSFSGFLSLDGYESHFLSSVEQDRNPNIRLYKESRYATDISKMAEDADKTKLNNAGKKEILDNFVTLGTIYDRNPENWEIKVSNASIYNGQLTIDYIKYVKPNLPATFPEAKKTIVKSPVTIYGFKIIQDNYNINLSMDSYYGIKNPSEVWKEWDDAVINNTDLKNTTLGNYLKFPLVDDLKNLSITVSNLDTADKDKKLDLQISIKDKAPTNVYFDGQQVKFNNELKNAINSSYPNIYPYKVSWSISTRNYDFSWNVSSQEDGITVSVNRLEVDLEKVNSIGNINKNMYANQVSDEDVISLISLENYTIGNDLKIIKNNTSGVIVATFSLVQMGQFTYDNVLNSSAKPLDTSGLNTKTILITNFKIPLSPITQYALILSLSITAVVLFIIIVSIIIKKRYSHYSNPLVTNNLNLSKQKQKMERKHESKKGLDKDFLKQIKEDEEVSFISKKDASNKSKDIKLNSFANPIKEKKNRKNKNNFLSKF